MCNNTHIFPFITALALCHKYARLQLIYSAYVTNGAIVKQAGWGLNMHYENFGKGIDDAKYSTCMTNELGEIRYRFKYCDLKDLVG